MYVQSKTAAPSAPWTSKLLPIGLFALLVVGLHAGADQLDDHVFSILNFVDRIFDALLSGVIHFLWGLVGATQASTEAAALTAMEWIDLDLKMAAAVWMAIGVELWVDAILALAILSPAAREVGSASEPADALRATFRDPTLLRWASPAAVLLASIAGSVSMAREIHVRVYELSFEAISNVPIAMGIAKLGGVSALVIGLVVLAPRAVNRAMLRAHRIAKRDLIDVVGLRRRFLRGGWTLAVAFPVALVAAVVATPVIRILRGLVGG